VGGEFLIEVFFTAQNGFFIPETTFSIALVRCFGFLVYIIGVTAGLNCFLSIFIMIPHLQ
jgi:hypothetical protein